MFLNVSRRKELIMNLKAFTTIQSQVITQGVYISGIIRNGNNYLINVGIFENGLVNVWDLVDLNLLQEKIDKSWLIPSFPDGENLHIHHLGVWKIDAAKWVYDKEGYYNHIVNIVKALNPEMTNLYDYFGCNTVKNGFVSVPKLNLTRSKPVKQHEKYTWQEVYGDDFFCFFKNGEKSYDLVNVNVFSDGKIQIANLENTMLLGLEEFEEEVKQARITTDIIEGSSVNILGLGLCVFGEGGNYVSMNEKMDEIKDMILKLNNKLTTSDICRNILDEYLANPNSKLKEKLKIAYENVPEHLRMYLGDMDVKDTEIRMIIYGDEEIENWSHYAVAKTNDEKLPSISIPKPLEEEE